MKNLTDGKEISFEEICSLLKQGKCLVVPTDTTYGLISWTGAKDSLQNLNKAKGNPSEKLPQVLCTFKQALELAYFDEIALKAAKNFWPGALTLVLKSTPLAKSFLKSETIGLRVPDNKLILDLAQTLGTGLFASSANLHGQGYTPDLEIITKVFSQKNIVVLEGISKGQSSSVVELKNKDIVFLREGEITEQIFKKKVLFAK